MMEMSRLEREEFIKKMPESAMLLGLDIGAKTIGLATASMVLRIATPIKTVPRTKFSRDAQALAEVISEYNIDGLVVGYPLELSGEEGRRCQSIRDFMVELERQIKCPLYAYQDERLSTASVDNLVDGAVSKRKAKEKGLTDKLAAQIILQGFIDKRA